MVLLPLILNVFRRIYIITMAENIKVRKFGLVGIASPIIGILAVLVSIYFSTWFEWTIHALSDLGVAQEGRLI